jgi:hypothetical protein
MSLSFCAVAAASSSGFASITASIWEQDAASVPVPLTGALDADDALEDSLAAEADAAGEDVIEVDEPPQPDSERLRMARATATTAGFLVIDIVGD